MPVSRLHDGVKFIEPQKGIQVTAKSRISQFADFARGIMNRYLVKSVYEFSSASFVFADWFHEDQDAEEKQRQERDILRLLAIVREFQKEKQIPAVYNHLIQQINRTVMVYENRLGEKSRELLSLCREVSGQGEKAPEYLRESETERRFAQLVMQLAGSGQAASEKMVPEKMAPDQIMPERTESAHTKVFTGRFHAGLENRVRTAGRIPSYTERFLNAKKESTECFRQVFTERLPLIRFVESLNLEEREQIQKLFPGFFAEHKDMVNAFSSMSRTRWTEWKKQVVEMFFPEMERLTVQMVEPGEKTERFTDEENFMDRVFVQEEQTAGKLAFFSVFSGAEQSEQILETVLNDIETEWARTERIFLEMSGEEEIQELQKIYQKNKITFAEQIRAGGITNLLNDGMTLEFARKVLKLEERRGMEAGNPEHLEDDVTNDAVVMKELLRTISLQKEQEAAEWTTQTSRPETAGQREAAGWTEAASQAEATGRTEAAGRASREKLTELLTKMAGFAGYPDAGATGGETANRKKSNDADAGMEEEPDTKTPGQGKTEQKKDWDAGMAAGKLALMMTVSELYGGEEEDLSQVIPELTEILNYSEENWEKAQTVFLHLKDHDLENGDVREPGVIYRDWKLSLDQAAGLGPEKTTDRKSRLLLSVMREFMKEKGFRFLTEQVMSRARLLPKRWETLTYEQKVLQVWQPETLLSYLKQASLGKEPDQRISEKQGAKAAHRQQTEGNFQPDIENEVRIQKGWEIREQLRKEYSSKKEEYIQKIQEQNGTVPDEMKLVLGKGPFLLMMERQEEAAEMAAELFYEIPELRRYRGSFANETDHRKRQERLREVIAGLDAGEWELLEHGIFEGQKGTKEAAAKKQLLERIVRVEKEQELWERIQKEYHSEKEEYVQKIQEQNGTIPEEMKPVLGKGPFLLMMERQEEAAEMVEGLFYEIPELKIYAKGFTEETDHGKKQEQLREVIASLDIREWKLLESKVFEKSGTGQAVETGQAAMAPIPKAKTTAGDFKKLADSFAAQADISFPLAEYRQKKEQISEQILKAAGRIPEEMQAVLGKLPLIQLLKESEETAEYVSRMLYEMPEMEIYTRPWQNGDSRKQPKVQEGTDKTGKTQPKAVEILEELIETLSPGEWKLVERRLLQKTENKEEIRAGAKVRPEDERKLEAGVENLPAMSNLEYRNIEKFLLREKDMAWDGHGGIAPFAAPALRQNLPDTVSLELLNLVSQDFRKGPKAPDMTLLSATAVERTEEGTLAASGVSNDIAGYPGAPQVFKEERLYTMLQESGIYAADRASSQILQVLRTSERQQASGPSGRKDSLGHAVLEYDSPGYDSVLPIPDRVIARTTPPKGMKPPVQDAKTQLQFLREQPAGKLSEEDIHTVQVMGNKVRTVNEYEERLTKLTEQITAQKAEIDELVQSHRKLSDPRRQQRIIERMMKQLRGQLRLERLQRGND